MTTTTKKMYGWSKYGGATQGMVKEELDEWFCQICTDQQVRGMPEYLIAEDERERDFLRVCGKCKYRQVTDHVTNMIDLMRVVRESHQYTIRHIENLLSLPSIM